MVHYKTVLAILNYYANKYYNHAHTPTQFMYTLRIFISKLLWHYYHLVVSVKGK